MDALEFGWYHVTPDTLFCFVNDAVVAGTNRDGSNTFVGRVHYQGALLPATVMPDCKKACISYNGEVIEANFFEILCSKEKVTWIANMNGLIPQNALKIGRTQDGEPLYMGRANHDNLLASGMIQGFRNCLLIPIDGQVHEYSLYDVLVVEKKQECCKR